VPVIYQEIRHSGERLTLQPLTQHQQAALDTFRRLFVRPSNPRYGQEWAAAIHAALSQMSDLSHMTVPQEMPPAVQEGIHRCLIVERLNRQRDAQLAQRSVPSEYAPPTAQPYPQQVSPPSATVPAAISPAQPRYAAIPPRAPTPPGLLSDDGVVVNQVPPGPPNHIHERRTHLLSLGRDQLFESIKEGDLLSAENLWLRLRRPANLTDPASGFTMLQALYKLQEHPNFRNNHPYLEAMIKSVAAEMDRVGVPQTRQSPNNGSFAVRPLPGAQLNRSLVQGFICRKQALVDALLNSEIEERFFTRH
jgi:hypothetical protein